MPALAFAAKATEELLGLPRIIGIIGPAPDFSFARQFVKAGKNGLSATGFSGAITWDITASGLYEWQGFCIATSRDSWKSSGFCIIDKGAGTVEEISRAEALKLVTARGRVPVPLAVTAGEITDALGIAIRQGLEVSCFRSADEAGISPKLTVSHVRVAGRRILLTFENGQRFEGRFTERDIPPEGK